LTLEQIPDAEGASPGAASTTMLADLKATRSRRRTVLRGVALGAMTVGATALDWSGLFSGRAARAETGPGGLWGWDRNDCTDAYPNGYNEAPDTGGAFAGTAACFGGTARGNHFCSGSGWFKNGVLKEGKLRDITATYVPKYFCGSPPHNAWKWTTPDGLVYRCSDGYKTIEPSDAIPQTFFAICRARV
jgi:hypothetical protein